MIKKLQQKGDTIIEVMFAVAIVGITIASAYGVATLSLRNARQAQERGEALKIAESQIESLRAIAAGDDTAKQDAIFDVASGDPIFCINSSGDPVNAKTAAGSNTIVDIASEKFADYSRDCMNGFYHASVDVVQGATGELYDYQVAIRWDSLGSDNKSELQIGYTLYKP
jgi:type II secretory pathway pseudopilin PulG